MTFFTGPLANAIEGITTVPEMGVVHWMAASALASIATIATAAAMGVDFLVWRAVGVLFVAVLVLMSVEIVTDYLSKAKGGNGHPWVDVFVQKMIVLSMVVISLVMDLVVYQVATHLPQDLLLLDQGYLFVTMTTCIWLAAAETSRIIANVEDAGHEDSIPPTLNILARQIKWILKSMRFIDSSRATALQKENEKRVPDHHERWYDDISDDEIEKLAKFLEGRSPSPPDSVKPLDPKPEDDK